MRIEPPPSLACAAGTMPAATAAAAPPDEPPAVCSRFHGLRVLPKSADSVDVVMPNSGDADLPEDHEPGAPVARHQLVLVVGHVVGEEARAAAWCARPGTSA